MCASKARISRGGLQERFGNHPFVGDVRGRGLFQGLELVADRGTKEPFDPQRKLHAQIKREAMARGLMVYPMGGTVDGMRGDHVLLAPPFIIDAAAIDTIVVRSFTVHLFNGDDVKGTVDADTEIECDDTATTPTTTAPAARAANDGGGDGGHHGAGREPVPVTTTRATTTRATTTSAASRPAATSRS